MLRSPVIEHWPVENYVHQIIHARQENSNGDRNVLVWHGAPESREYLGSALQHYLHEVDQRVIRLDGNGMASYATDSSALRSLQELRRCLALIDIECPCFDIAYWFYWSALHPQEAFLVVRFAFQMAHIDELGRVLSVDGTSEVLDRFGAIAKGIIQQLYIDIQKAGTAALSYANCWANLPWLVTGLDDPHQDWWKNHGQQDLQELQEIDGNPYRIPALLPIFLARDLNFVFSSPAPIAPPSCLTILIDAYDALVEDPETSRCGWLDLLIQEVRCGDRVLWVILSDDSHPNSAKILKQEEIAPLSDSEIVSILRRTSITDLAHQHRVVRLVKGSPLYLAWAIAAWENTPSVIESLSSESEDIVASLLATRSSEVQKGIQLLSFPISFTLPQAEQIITAFLPDVDAHCLVHQIIENLYVESLDINPLSQGQWFIHPIMRQSLQTQLTEEASQSIHQLLYDDYKNQYETKEHVHQVVSILAPLSNALHHTLQATPFDPSQLDWILHQILSLIERYQPVESLLNRVFQTPDLPISLTCKAWLCEGSLNVAQEDWEAAISALEKLRQQIGTGIIDSFDTRTLIDGLQNLATAYLNVDRIGEADATCLLARQLLQNCPTYNGSTLLNLHAEIKAIQDDPDEAISLSNQAISMSERDPDVTPSKHAEILQTAAWLRCSGSFLVDAAELCREALYILRQTMGEDHDLTITCYGLLGDMCRRLGRTQAQNVDAYYKQAIHACEIHFGLGHPQTQIYLSALMKWSEKIGQTQSAQILREEIQIHRQIANLRESVEIADYLTQTGLSMYEENYDRKAEALLSRALKMHQKLLGSTHLETSNSLCNLALVYFVQGRYEKAEKLLQSALEIRQQTLGDNHLEIAHSLSSLAAIYVEQKKRYDEAESMLKRALDIRRNLLGDRDMAIANSLNNLGGLYEVQERYSEARSFYEKALDICLEHVGHEHFYTETVLSNLRRLRDENA